MTAEPLAVSQVKAADLGRSPRLGAPDDVEMGPDAARFPRAVRPAIAGHPCMCVLIVGVAVHQLGRRRVQATEKWSMELLYLKLESGDPTTFILKQRLWHIDYRQQAWDDDSLQLYTLRNTQQPAPSQRCNTARGGVRQGQPGC